MIDFSSDTVTQPTDQMWTAMREARFGCMPNSENSSITELEALAAKLTGKQNSLFLPTTTMANLVALLSHTQPGDQILLDSKSHILWSEEWAYANICGLTARTIETEAGTILVNQIESALSEHQFLQRPQITLICIENSHNAFGGTIIHADSMRELGNTSRKHRIPIHLDGARILNASVALNETLETMVADADSVAISLCKGLSAPEGSMLCGSQAFIAKCKRNAKRLGGGSLHKADIPAAAGIVAFNNMLPQLAEDNRRAYELGKGISALDHQAFSIRAVQTNIVMLTVDPNFLAAETLLHQLEKRNIKAKLYSDSTIRFVTHRHIDDADIVSVVHNITEILELFS